MNDKDECKRAGSSVKVLCNEELTVRLVALEKRVEQLLISWSPRVTWEVSQDELAETEKRNVE